MRVYFQVKLNKTEVSRLTRPEIVETSNDGTVIKYTLMNPINFVDGKMNIKKILRRLHGQVISCFDDQECHTNRCNGIQPEEVLAWKNPLSHPDQKQGDHNTD